MVWSDKYLLTFEFLFPVFDRRTFDKWCIEVMMKCHMVSMFHAVSLITDECKEFSFLVVFLQRGTSFMGETYRLDTSMADIFIGVVLLFIIGCEFFINYKINFRKDLFGSSSKKNGKEVNN